MLPAATPAPRLPWPGAGLSHRLFVAVVVPGGGAVCGTVLVCRARRGAAKAQDKVLSQLWHPSELFLARSPCGSWPPVSAKLRVPAALSALARVCLQPGWGRALALPFFGLLKRSYFVAEALCFPF